MALAVGQGPLNLESREIVKMITPTRSAVHLVQAKRWLNLQEYHSKQLMAKYGVNTQKFRVSATPEEAYQAAKELNAEEIVLKAQIHAGGRGKGHFSSGLLGGIQLAKDPRRVEQLSSQMLGHNLVTKQTSTEGVPVRKVMVAEALNISRETYFAVLMDRATGGPVMVGSPDGGMDIEAVAERTPERIFKEPVDIVSGPTGEQLERMARNLGFGSGADQLREAMQQMHNLYNLFINVDATQVEINPFGVTDNGKIISFDAKINSDDNAEFRQKAIFAERDFQEEDPREVAANAFNLNYIGMNGSIGCLVNGAGLAMATMDIIKLHGGEPANFLDVGGSAGEKQVKEAFKLITSDRQVRAILVNIFGGILKCDTIASGIVAAARETQFALPLIVRLSGTNVTAGQRILAESGLPIITAHDLDQAAQCAVQAATAPQHEKSVSDERQEAMG